MKLFRNSIYLGLAAVGSLAFASCSEDDTLSGAKEVYITLDPASVSLSLGDTVKVSASVSNLSGDEINTPIVWSTDDPEVARVVEFRDTVFTTGDTIYTALPDSSQYYIERVVKSIGDQLYHGVVATEGAQGKTTKLRATLSNGKFAVGAITVTNHSPKGVEPVAANRRIYRPSSLEVVDTIWFAVDPWAIVADFQPTCTLEKLDKAPSQLALAENPILINEKTHRVGVLVLPDRSYGEFKLTLTVGGNGDTTSGTANITVGPNIKVGMWDPDIDGMTPPSGDQFYGFNYEVRKTIDINSEVKIYARLMVEGGRTEDIANARNSYSWEMESGQSLLVVGKEEVNNEYGFDCILTLRSGITPGENVIGFCSPDTAALVMKGYVTVLDYNKDFPVNDIIVTAPEGMSLDNLYTSAKGNLEIDVRVDPLTSLAYHRPEVTIEDPSVLEFVSYSGTLLTLKGLKPGTTNFTLTSLGITKTFKVTVNEEIVQIDWASALDRMVAGQSSEFSINVTTASGLENTLPVVWASSNKSVIEVTGSGMTATVKALADGTSTLTATITSAAGKVTSVSRVITVAAGLDDIVVNDANIGSDGDAGYYTNSANGRHGFYVSLPSLGYHNIWIYTKDTMTEFDGQIAASIFADADIDGSAATVTGSTLTLSGHSGSAFMANGEITLSMGGAAVKIVFDNVELFHD